MSCWMLGALEHLCVSALRSFLRKHCKARHMDDKFEYLRLHGLMEHVEALKQYVQNYLKQNSIECKASGYR